VIRRTSGFEQAGGRAHDPKPVTAEQDWRVRATHSGLVRALVGRNTPGVRLTNRATAVLAVVVVIETRCRA